MYSKPESFQTVKLLTETVRKLQASKIKLPTLNRPQFFVAKVSELRY